MYTFLQSRYEGSVVMENIQNLLNFPLISFGEVSLYIKMYKL